MRRLGLVIVLVFGLGAAVASAHPEPGDVDGDGVRDEFDNCAQVRNADQGDVDGDRLGNRCDADADADGVANSLPFVGGPDNCPLASNPGQEDDGPEGTPGDGIGDACDRDDDRDRVTDARDNCPGITNPDQADYDFDRTGDVCDPDDDEDGEFDVVDNCPRVYNYDQADLDGDGRGTACDDSEATAGGPGGQPSASDRKAPTVRLRLDGTQRLRELGGRLAIRVRCSESCAISARLTVSRATARRLRLGRRPTIVARGAAALADRGSTYVFLRFKRGMVRRLSRGRAVRASLAVAAADGAGNVRTATRRLRLRR